MPRYGVVLLSIVGLAAISLAVLLYLQGREPGLGMPPPATVQPCKWDPALYTNVENTCYRRCGPPYTPSDLPVAGGEGPPGNVKTLDFCCPKGYPNLCGDEKGHTCSSKPCS